MSPSATPPTARPSTETFGIATPLTTPLPTDAQPPHQTADAIEAAARQAETASGIPDQPSESLLAFILGFLAPMLMTGSTADPGTARLAAIEILAAYHTRTQAELISIAQIVAYRLAAMDNLRLSTAPDLSLALKLRLRAGATALHRAAQQQQRSLQRRRHPSPPPAVTSPQPPPMAAHFEALRHREDIGSAGQAASPTPVQPPASPTHMPSKNTTAHGSAEPNCRPSQRALADHARRAAPMTSAQRINLLWASAMTDVAEEVRDTLDSLPAALRQAEMTRVGALTEAASVLAAGYPDIARPTLRKFDLMGSTALGGGLDGTATGRTVQASSC